MSSGLSDPYKQLLKDFILLEMLHDYKSERDNKTDKSKSARVINTQRYKKIYKENAIVNKNNLDYILNIAIPDSFNSYIYNQNIERMFTNNEPETTMLSYMTGMSKKTTIQSFMNLKVISSKNGVGKWNFTCPISNNSYDVTAVARTDNGVEFVNKLFERNPVILTDTMVWVWKTFKSGRLPKPDDNVKKIYCFSPLPVRADSASKAECIDYKIIKSHSPYPWFQNKQSKSGIELVNVISNETFTSNFLNTQSKDNHGFFSKYKITTQLNPYDKNLVQQYWSGLDHAGSLDPLPNKDSNRSVKINDAHFENSQPKTFIDINSRINNDENNETFHENLKKNDKVLNNLVTLTTNKNKIDQEIVSLALQRKRSGDWLPVHYIREYNKNKPHFLKNFSLNDDDSNLLNKPLESEDEDKFFFKENMYILTNDRPLVSYCILCGVNVLFIASTTPDPLIIKFEAPLSATSSAAVSSSVTSSATAPSAYTKVNLYFDNEGNIKLNNTVTSS